MVTAVGEEPFCRLPLQLEESLAFAIYREEEIHTNVSAPVAACVFGELLKRRHVNQNILKTYSTMKKAYPICALL